MIEKTSNNPPTVELRFPEEGISVKAVSGTTLNTAVLNLIVLTSSESHSGNIMLNSAISEHQCKSQMIQGIKSKQNNLYKSNEQRKNEQENYKSVV